MIKRIRVKVEMATGGVTFCYVNWDGRKPRFEAIVDRINDALDGGWVGYIIA